jgi:hypothetical protein
MARPPYPGKRHVKWSWPVTLLDPYAAGQASYNFHAAATIGFHAAAAAQQAREDEREAARERMAAQAAGEAARAARAAMRASAAAELLKLKMAMRDAHPDHGGSSAAFRKALYVYRAARRGYRAAPGKRR